MKDEKLDLFNALTRYVDVMDGDKESVICITNTKEEEGNIIYAFGDLNLIDTSIIFLTPENAEAVKAILAIASTILVNNKELKDAFILDLEETSLIEY